jgi:two-component system phosphate regulon response regulator PhoB
MNKASIVIIEDELEINELIRNQLQESHFECHSFTDGKKALDYIQSPASQEAQLFILDRMLPSVNGLEICKFIRLYKNTATVPILMLTALSTPEQIVEGLDAGADDYMTKPFDLGILQARVRSLLRRRQQIQKVQSTSNQLKLKELVLDLDQCKVWIGSQLIELTLSEFKLLSCFLQSPGKVLTRNQLVEFIQEGPVHVTDRTIDTHIFGLRKKLGEYANFIETIRGVGYRVIGQD